MSEKLKFDVYIITLKHREDRIKAFKTFYHDYLDQINIVFGLTKQEIEEKRNDLTTTFCNRFCTTPMIGCATSHIMVWKEVCKTGKVSLVLEDDTFVDLKKVNNLFADFEKLSKSFEEKIFLQLVGEGFFLKRKTRLINGELTTEFLTFEEHLFLGCYMLNAEVASLFVKHYEQKKIDYHIDFSLNKVMKKYQIKPFILNEKIGVQTGQTDSNMISNNENIIFNPTKASFLHYALNLPIIKVNNIVITFCLIIFILIGLLLCFFNNPFMFALLGFSLCEIIKIN